MIEGERPPTADRRPRTAIGRRHRERGRCRSLITHHSSFITSRSGQALVEYAIVFPLQLMLTLALIQLAHLFVAKQILDYAAFCGARAALVGLEYEDAQKAAAIPISRIAGPSGVSGDNPIDIPGWGTLRGSGAAVEKTSAPYGNFDVIQTQAGSAPVIRCEIEHAYELRVPVGNVVSYTLGDVFLAAEDLERIGGMPHVRIKAACTLPQPWAE